MTFEKKRCRDPPLFVGEGGRELCDPKSAFRVTYKRV